VIVVALASFPLAAPPPRISLDPVQDSPIVVRLALRPRTRRLVCSVDGGHARACDRTTRLRLSPGRHAISAWAVMRSGRPSRKARAAVVVAQREPKPVDVGGQPVGIAAAGSDLWVCDGSGGNAVRVDAGTRQVTARVAIGGQLGGIAATASAVWVSVYDGGQVVRVDPATNAVAARIAVGGQPTSLAVDAAGQVWVGNLDGSAMRIDPATDLVSATVRLAAGASTLLPVGNLIWIGLQNGSLVSLDPATGALTGAAIAVAPDVDALASTPNGLWASTFDGTAALVDTGTRRVVRRVRLPGRGSGIAYAGGRVWVTVYDRRYVLALDPARGTFVAAVHAGAQPRDSVVVGSTLWVLDQLNGAVVPVTP
jgi:sugar lactone lactonase YvrE